MYWRYFNAKRKNSQFTTSAIFSCRCCSSRTKDWPMEAYMKIFFVFSGCCFELFYAVFGKNGYENNVQHATMYLMLGLNSVVDILVHYKAPIPPNMDYISLALSVASEGLLFKFHVHGRKDLDVLLHTLLVYTIAANTTAIILELKYRHSIVIALCRPYFFLIQGSWFWQTGWILYPPFPWSLHWDQQDHGQIMIAASIFIWHLGVNFLIVLGVGWIVASLVKQRDQFRPLSMSDDTVDMERLINKDDQGEVKVKLGGDTESEIYLEYDTNICI